MNVYTIFEFNSGGRVGDKDNPLYFSRGHWAGKTARDALTRFMWERCEELIGLNVADSMEQERDYFFTGRNRVGSFGKGQFHAQKNGLVKLEDAS